MSIPTFKVKQLVNKDGTATPNFQSYLELLTQISKNYLSPNGILVPQVAADDIADLDPSRTAIMLDSTNNQLKVYINGTLRTITTT